MPLHGKIVVIKRSGGDGTEFPLTASCLFGRKPDCDIRIQLPQVSKEHCRIELNENKEVILTNLSSVNPTRVNGEVMQQSERLKHGDVITVIDRSFRFEYPPAPTPKKRRNSTAGKAETLQVLQDQQVRDTATETGEKRISEASTDVYLKDGTNNDNIQRSLEKTIDVESKEDGSLLQSKASSPFNDLYQMIKQTLNVKTPRKPSDSQPGSRFCTPKPGSVRKTAERPAVSTEVKSTPKKVEAEASSGAIAVEGNSEVENKSVDTPKSVKKQRKSFQVPTSEMSGLEPTEQASKSATSTQETPKNKRLSLTSRTPTTVEATSTPQRKLPMTPQSSTVSDVVEQISSEKPKTPTRRRSKEATPVKPAVTPEEQAKATQPSAPTTEPLRRTSPRTAEKKLKAQDVAIARNEKQETLKRKSGELGADLPTQKLKRKRVSFGGQLDPELFDKRLPPDSPLRKGATPRRSLCVIKPKNSLLRRASAIGLIKEFEHELASPKVQSPANRRTPSPKKSPKAKTPSPGKKSPKAKTPSPKTPSPGKKSPKAKTPSPKTPSRDKSQTPKAEKSPKTQRKSTTPAQKTPTGKRRSSLVVSSPPSQETTVLGVTPAKPENQTPTVQGRFSVSRVSTPSPMSEQVAAAVPVPVVAVTPKLPLRRKSMKSTSRKSVVKNAVEVMRRRSGISRASMKVINSWADIVKFGQTKSQVVAPAKNATTTKKTRKVVVSKPKTPARRLKDHVSTGHADSPVTIVVGKAHKQKLVQPTGAAPRLVHNTAVLKKSLKMDEDLTGVAEIFKTPVNARQRKSVINEQSATKTPLGLQTTSLVEASVLSTPEEPGEMIVSPLGGASAVKHGRYNSEAVHRLLHSDEESPVVGEIPALEITTDDPSEQQCTDMKLAVATPKQKPEQPECLTGIKRIMKTPRQKAEPVEDLRGRLLKTPKAPKVTDVCLDGVKELLETPRRSDLSEVMAMDSPLVVIKRTMKTPKEKNAPVEDMVGLKRLMQTPKNKGEPVEENFGLKRLMKSPRLKGNAAVEDFEGLQELMEEPPSNSSPQMETNEGQDQTPLDCGSDMEKEPEVTSEEQQEDVPCALSEDGPSDIVENVPQADITKEPEVTSEEQQEDVPCALSEDGPSDIVENVPQADITTEPEAIEVVSDDQAEEMPCGHGEDAPSDAMETVPQAVVEQNLPEEQPQVETATCEVTEMDTANIAPDTQKKSARGRRAKVVEPKAADDEQEATEQLEDTVVPAPVKGRRGKKTESAPLPTIRQTARSRNAKANESRDVELTEEVSETVAPKEKVAPKPKRGRNAKQTSIDQAESVPEVAVEAVNDQAPEANDSATAVEEAVLKPKRGRKNNQASVEQPTPSENTQPEEPIPAVTIEKPKRGRKLKQDSVVVEDTGNAVETKQQPQAPVRSKRGRNAKLEEEKVEGDGEIPPVETAEAQEPCEKSKRTRKAKQEPAELKEVQMAETPVTEKVEAPVVASKGRRAKTAKQDSVESVEEIPAESASSATLAEAVEVHEPAAVVAAEKPRRGGRRTKQDAKSVIPVASTEVQDKPAVNPTEKPKRGRRVKQDLAVEEVEIVGEVPEEKAEQKQEVKEDNMDDPDSASALAGEQPDAPVIKPTRGRGVKSVKNEVSQAVPAKRARRGAAPPLQEAAVTEAAVVVSKPGSRGRAGKLSKAEDADNTTEASVEPAKRGRKAAAKPVKKPTAAPSTEQMVEEKCVTAELPPVEVTKGRASRKGKAVSAAHTDQAHATEDVNNAVVDDTQASKKSVNWKTNLAVTYEITTPTPVAKAARGRKAKLVDQDEASQGTPTKRVRRGKESTEPSAPETSTSKPDTKRKTSRSANKAEEEDLSDKALPSELIKRARRGAKVTEAASEAVTQGAEEMESAQKVPDRRRVNASKKAVAVDSVQAVEAETQPRTRRGRAAKK